MDLESQEFTHPLSAHSQFEQFVGNIRHPEKEHLTPGILELAAQVYNSEREQRPGEQIDLLFHFTDKAGSERINSSVNIGFEGQRTYLTKVTPKNAIPLMSEVDSKKFESYLKGERIPQNLKKIS